MNSYYSTRHLLTGALGDATGEYQSTKIARNCLYNFFVSGSGYQITLEMRSPFFANSDGIPFYSLTGTSGYAVPLFSDSPVGDVRAIYSGQGRAWASVNVQN